MSTSSPLPIAIVGSGPSGCFIAQALRRAWPKAPITVFDRLTTPFGLVRYGVSPDHQHTKTISRQFDRIFTRDGVKFAGNIEIGTDLTLDQLRAAFPVVVLATGLSCDRPLDIPGADLPGIHGAGRLTRVLNGHPDEADLLPAFGENIVTIGSGNVAVDIVRFLVKTKEHFNGSDIDDELLDAYAEAPAHRIDIVSRSPLPSVKADAVMLRELGRITGVQFRAVGDTSLPTDADQATTRRVEAVRELVAGSPAAATARVEVTFHFGRTPVAVHGTDRVHEVVLADRDGQTYTLPADSVITAIGFTRPPDGLSTEPSLDEPDPKSGRIRPGLYRTGWLRRGPRGTIPENRGDALVVAAEIVADVEVGAVTAGSGSAGFEVLPDAVRKKAVSYADWCRVEAAEREDAPENRVRRKIRNREHMIALASGGKHIPARQR
ncbi:FAD-dependent oxidoreductase [Nocardia sp. NPDC004860]|uniref:FAD-dependent oxidoreductase n=1 Tax=Nocardia sp. NPDC004860 TaxID=3154557 RepID=UPI0033ABB2DE